MKRIPKITAEEKVHFENLIKAKKGFDALVKWEKKNKKAMLKDKIQFKKSYNKAIETPEEGIDINDLKAKYIYTLQFPRNRSYIPLDDESNVKDKILEEIKLEIENETVDTTSVQEFFEIPGELPVFTTEKTEEQREESRISKFNRKREKLLKKQAKRTETGKTAKSVQNAIPVE